MREGPSKSDYATARGHIPNSEQVIVKSGDFDGWSFCSCQGVEGWIRTEFLFDESGIVQFRQSAI